MSKKSQSISINTIIIAAIALVVLITAIVIFTRQAYTSTKTLQSCQLKGGKCANGNSCPPSQTDKEYNIPVIVDDPSCGQSKLCCLKLG